VGLFVPEWLSRANERTQSHPRSQAAQDNRPETQHVLENQSLWLVIHNKTQ
jgi:hypothetical protein